MAQAQTATQEYCSICNFKVQGIAAVLHCGAVYDPYSLKFLPGTDVIRGLLAARLRFDQQLVAENVQVLFRNCWG
jgi:hypothetical protein